MLVIQIRIEGLLVILLIANLNTFKRFDYKFCKPSLNDSFLVYSFNFIIFDEFYKFSQTAAF